MTTMFLTDVYSNPDEYVSSLKKKGFEDFNDGVNVFKNVQKLERDDVAKSIESLINAELVLSFARMSVLGQEEPNFIHKDDMHGDYTAIIYLNKKYPSEYGTTLYDEDNNGFLVEEELVKILRATHMATDDKQVLKKAKTILRQVDKDGDGKVSREEFAVVAEKFPNILFPRMQAKKKEED